jgi:hypothetical protein
MNSTLGVVVASGVDQATPFNNGTFATAAASPLAVTITSAVGDMTCDTGAVQAFTLSAPTQTQRWNDTVSNYGAGSTGDGAATVAHSWTMSGSESDAISGANFKQEGGGGGAALQESEYFVMQAQGQPVTVGVW